MLCYLNGGRVGAGQGVQIQEPKVEGQGGAAGEEGVEADCLPSPVLPRLLLFSPSVVHLGVPLSVGLQLQDAPQGQVVKGSVFLRNPYKLNVPCSPKVDFTLTSEKDFILLKVQVTRCHSLLLLSTSHSSCLSSVTVCLLTLLPLLASSHLNVLFLLSQFLVFFLSVQSLTCSFSRSFS